MTLIVFLSSTQSYPQDVMEKINEMGEGIAVPDAPVHKTMKELMARGKRSGTSGNAVQFFLFPVKS